MSIYDKLLKIDDKTIGDHHHLTKDDHCYYFGNYTAKNDGAPIEGHTNQLINNIKKGVDRRGRPEYFYKERDIKAVSNLLSEFSNLDSFTFIPVPPSEMKGDPDYDDRLEQILKGAKGLHFCELVTQKCRREKAHRSGARRNVEELINNLSVVSIDPASLRDTLIIFDDILTTGRSFKAMSCVLKQAYPNKKIVGLFVARIARPILVFDDISDFDDI